MAGFFFATRPLIAPGDDAPASDAPVQMARVESSPEAGRMGTPADETMAAPMTEAVPVGRGAAAVIPAQAVPAATGATGSGAANEGRDRTDAAAHPAQLAASKPAAAAPGAPSAEGTARDKKEAAEAIGNVTFEAKSVVAPKPVAVAADATHPATIALQESAAPRGGGDRALFVAVPGGIVRWQFGQDGRVRRSVDGGKSWQERSLGDRVDLAAGSAPLPNVCWVVGSGGTVLLTVDGEIWQRRPFPFPLDLAAVRAADARSAVVIARDGRRFETHDGGVTWR